MQAGSGILGASPSMEEGILTMDWGATPLGALASWPLALTSIVSLILASGKPMFVVWGPHRILLYNDAYVALLGSKHPAALGRPYFGVWPDAARDLGLLFDRLFGNAAVEMDDISISFDREDESIGAQFAASYTPIRDQSHRIVGVLCIHSEAIRAKSVSSSRLLPRDHQRLAKIFEQAPNLIAISNGPEHRVELANAMFQQVVGEYEIIGKPLAEVLPDAISQGLRELLDQVFQRREVISRRAALFSQESAAGDARQERFIDFVLQPITDAIDQVTGIFVHGSDVTERVRTDQALRERETHLTEENADLGRLVTARSEELRAKEALIHAVYEYSSEGHIVVREIGDGRFRVEEVNPAALALYAATREQVIGCTIDEILSPAQADSVNTQLSTCLSNEGATHCEWVYEGSILEGVASPLPAPAAGGRQIAISARDVTERRNLEEQLRQSQKMEAVGQLTGGLAHDFNNLLTGIMGALDILQRRMSHGQSVDASPYITVARGAAQRAAALTQRLLAFARRQPLDAQSINVNRLVRDMHDLIDRTMGPTIHVEIDAAAALWNAWVDPNQLENALLNLCINARDAMPKGGRLVIETRNQRVEKTRAAEHGMQVGDYVLLSVSDTGTGMSAAVMAKVFEPFFTTKPTGEGTGLGLSMVYGFARQSGGHVWIESEVNSGTTVRIVLPRHVGAPIPHEHSDDPTIPRRAQRGETILVVDDEPMIRMWVTEVLHDLGYVTLEAENGLEGLKLVNSDRRIDLLITDIGLPGGIDGRQLAAAVRAVRNTLPILLMTGYGEDVEGQFMPAVIGEDVLRKPFSMHELALRVSSIFQNETFRIS
jgi:PAS domain S-box-containing protein